MKILNSNTKHQKMYGGLPLHLLTGNCENSRFH